VAPATPAGCGSPAFDAIGFPLTDDCASTGVPGLYFCRVHFLRKRKSAVLFGIGEDAAIVARSIARKQPHHQHVRALKLVGGTLVGAVARSGEPGRRLIVSWL